MNLECDLQYQLLPEPRQIFQKHVDDLLCHLFRLFSHLSVLLFVGFILQRSNELLNSLKTYSLNIAKGKQCLLNKTANLLILIIRVRPFWKEPSMKSISESEKSKSESESSRNIQLYRALLFDNEYC